MSRLFFNIITSGTRYGAVYQAALDYALANNIEPPYYTEDRIRENALIESLVSLGVWATVDQFAFLSSYASSDWSILNIKSPGSAISVAKRSNYTYTLGLVS